MKLTAIRLVNVRGVQLDVALDKGPLVVTGPPGSGRTTVLEAIVAAKENAGAYGMAPRARDFARGTGSVELRWELELFEQQTLRTPHSEVVLSWDLGRSGPQEVAGPVVADWLRTYSTSPTRWKMEYLHATRTLPDGPSGPSAGVEPALRLTRDASKYAFVRPYLEQVAREESASALANLKSDGIVLADGLHKAGSRFADALGLLNPRLRWDGCEVGAGEGERSKTWFVRPVGPRVELGELTSSESMAVLVAAAWARLGLEHATLLVDHPEAQLHPEQHAGFFDALAALMRKGQLIVTTTSPAILRSVGSAKVVVLEGRG
jgi:predicted ATPase